jgi:hypothetical protein
LEIRFWLKVRKTETCWIWTGCKSGGGYGFISRNKVAVHAHRVSWELHNGPIPEGMEILHNCPEGDNPACVNPAHLRVGTHAENMADTVIKGQAVKGEQVSISKLTEESVREIRRLLNQGNSLAKLAAQFHVGHSTIGAIRYRKTWRHVT